MGAEGEGGKWNRCMCFDVIVSQTGCHQHYESWNPFLQRASVAMMSEEGLDGK